MNFSFFTFSRVGVGLLSLGIISSFNDVRAAQLGAVAEQTPLQVLRNACLSGDIATVESLVSGIDFDNDSNQMLLCQAAAAGHADICTALIAAGAAVDARDTHLTALTIAAGRDRFEVVRELLRAGAMVTVTDIAAATATEARFSENRFLGGKAIATVLAPALFTGGSYMFGESRVLPLLGAITTAAGMYYLWNEIKEYKLYTELGLRPSGLGLGKPSILAELYARGARPTSGLELINGARSLNRTTALRNYSLIRAAEKRYWGRKALIEQTFATDDSECAEELTDLVYEFERNQPDSPGYDFNRASVIRNGFNRAEKETAQKLAELITMFEQDQVAWCPYNLRQTYAKKRELLGESINGTTDLLNLIESFVHDERIMTYDPLAV